MSAGGGRGAAGRVVVVTGSTRGIGLGLADALLARGCRVAVSGRSRRAVDEAVEGLASRHDAARIAGVACDVGEYADVKKLWDEARARFGRVDVWINNAGTSNPQRPFVEQTPETIRAVVTTNLLGVMHGARVAIEGMLAQPGGGQVYNMEGFGSGGEVREGMALYGATKRALRYLSRALVLETRGTAVQVCTLSPGIVVTDLLVGVYAAGTPEIWRRQRFFFNVVADTVETVAPWLADRVLANRRAGAHIAWMTVPKAALRFLSPRYLRRDLFAGRALPTET